VLVAVSMTEAASSYKFGTYSNVLIRKPSPVNKNEARANPNVSSARGCDTAVFRKIKPPRGKPDGANISFDRDVNRPGPSLGRPGPLHCYPRDEGKNLHSQGQKLCRVSMRKPLPDDIKFDALRRPDK
jgi:hypothetical protein